MRVRFLLLFCFFIVVYEITNAGDNGQSLVGKTVTTLRITDPNNNAKDIPFIGQYVVTVFYTDPDQKDVNEPLSTALLEKKYPLSHYRGIGIGNCSETWLPNSIIRMASRQKQEKYPNSVILLDDNNVVKNKWGLGDCSEAGVVIVIGKDSKIKFVTYIKSQDESKSIIKQVFAIIDHEIAK